MVHGCAPFEFVPIEFGEPSFAYTNIALKGYPKVLAFGKRGAGHLHYLHRDSTVMLTRSIRRIATDSKCHLKFYLHFNATTWQFKSGFGGRVTLTTKFADGKSENFEPPAVPVLLHRS